MQRDREQLKDILEAASLALSYVQGKTVEQFLKDTQCQDAVIRRLEIIGEAARRISEEIKDSLPDLPWKDMVGMRNLLIHEYDDVDVEVVWQTVQNDLPDLVETIERALAQDEL